MEKHIEIGGKEYILAPTRKILKTINDIAPEYLSLKEDDEEAQSRVSMLLFSETDRIFYELIKVKQPELTKGDSDKILEQFDDEYGSNNVSQAVLRLAMAAFTDGGQGSAKKKIPF
jgi:hypothetical protein